MRADQYLPPTAKQLARRLAAADVPGRHLWIMTGAWTVSPRSLEAGDTTLMDRENLIAFGGPGCFKCEQEYTPQLAARGCDGKIDHG